VLLPPPVRRSFRTSPRKRPRGDVIGVVRAGGDTAGHARPETSAGGSPVIHPAGHAIPNPAWANITGHLDPSSSSAAARKPNQPHNWVK
jgi:hypothetical protein